MVEKIKAKKYGNNRLNELEKTNQIDHLKQVYILYDSPTIAENEIIDLPKIFNLNNELKQKEFKNIDLVKEMKHYENEIDNLHLSIKRCKDNNNFDTNRLKDMYEQLKKSYKDMKSVERIKNDEIFRLNQQIQSMKLAVEEHNMKTKLMEQKNYVYMNELNKSNEILKNLQNNNRINQFDYDKINNMISSIKNINVNSDEDTSYKTFKD